MFIIDLRNKLVSKYNFSVINNNNVDVVHIFSHFTQYSSGYKVYLKVLATDETYVDKIEIDSQDVSVEDGALIVKWTMGAVSTQCKEIKVQLQFENNDATIIAQSRIVNIVLGDTIDVDEEAKHIYPKILEQLQEQIDELKDDSVASITSTYANDLLTINLFNKAGTQLGTAIEVAIPVDTVATNLANHIADKGNPHEVTKSQVGLGNVDNTSDLDKPVSTAQQTALDGKVDKTNTSSKLYGTDGNGNQTTVQYGAGAVEGRIPQRVENGQINVPLTPTNDAHASSKKYTDDSVKVMAKSLVVSMNSSTYVITFTLKDKDNNTLSEQTVDLPLESVVVGGSYDDETKSIILVLDNGTEIDIPVADLVAGLVQTTRTIAGIDLEDDITAQELTDALVLTDTTDDVGYIMGVE